MDFFKFSDDEIFSIAKPIIDSMKDGVNRKNYKLFSSYFSTKMLELVGEMKFLEQTGKNILELGELRVCK